MRARYPALATLTLLVGPAFILSIPPVAAGPNVGTAVNWNGGSNPYGSNENYSPQIVITQSNVASLTPNWVWPVPVNVQIADQGIENAPMIVGGVIYLLSQAESLYALNAKTGQIIWQKAIPISYNQNLNVHDIHARAAGPLAGLPSGHYHDGSWAYTQNIYGQPLIWVDSNNYTFYAFNALTGTQVEHFTLYQKPSQIPGNFGFYSSVSPMFIIDEPNQLLLTGFAVGDQNNGGRGAYALYTLTTNPPSLVKYIFLMPPQDDSQPSWSFQSVTNMTHAWIFNGTGAADLKSLSPATLHTMLDNDWGTMTRHMGFNGTLAAVTMGDGFGGPWAFDSKTKVMYATTSQPSPDQNATYRPGPDLWSDSVLAINETTGSYIWGFQGVPHDLQDYDCSWNTILANITYAGATHEAVIKGCKSGYVFALDAKTGQLFWYMTAPQTDVKRGHYNTILNPLSQSDMTKPWMSYPSTATYVTNPGSTGSLESNIAYDPVTNLVFTAQFNNPNNQIASDVPPGVPAGYKLPSAATCQSSVCAHNATLYALNAATGAIQWKVFFNNLSFRGGITVSNGIVFIPCPDGFLRFYSESTGAPLNSINVGGPASPQPSIGQDSNGNTIVVYAIGISQEFAGANPLGEVPGFVVEYALSPSATVTSTGPTVTLSGSTVTASGSTVTVPGTTVTASGNTVTQTQTVSGAATSGGVSSTTLYGVAGVAVVFAITTGFFALRGRGKAAPT